MADITLVIIDVQDKLIDALTIDDRKAVLAAIEREVVEAKENGSAIILCEYEPEVLGATAKAVMKHLKGYKRFHTFSHCGPCVADEVLAIANQQNYARRSFRLCGLYRKSGVTATEAGIRHCTNFQAEVVVVPDGCADVVRPHSFSV